MSRNNENYASLTAQNIIDWGLVEVCLGVSIYKDRATLECVLEDNTGLSLKV
jgi:hypothetical protein